MSVAFLACVERGRLEEQTILLCRSVRRNAERYRDAPIYTFQPRQGTAVRGETYAALDSLGVTHSTEPLNTKFHDYAIGNKIFVCAWAEQILKEDTLIFLDSDTVMVGEPADLDLSPATDGAVRPAYSHFLNSTGPGHPMDAYWRRVYEILGVEHEAFVETELGTRVRAYFSAGLIAVRRSAGLFGQWKRDFFRLVSAGHVPPSTGIRRMDEVSLAATLSRTFPRLRILDGRYNYLIYKRPQLPPPWREAQLNELVHVHYRDAFNRQSFLHEIQPPIDLNTGIVRWLERQLPLTPATTSTKRRR